MMNPRTIGFTIADRVGVTNPNSHGGNSASAVDAAGGRARWTIADLVSLGLLLALAGALHWHFAASGLSFDELWHLSLSAGKAPPQLWLVPDMLYLTPDRVTSADGTKSLADVWTGMSGVLHPPLYVVMLRGWRAVFGESDAAAQWLSITWSMIAVAGVFGAARLTMGRGLAIFCALAFALSPTQAYFAQEVRGYQMLVGLGALSLWLMTWVELAGPTRGRAILLGLAPLPLLLTHYFAAGVVVAMVVHGFARLRGHRLAFSMSLLSTAAVYAIAWLPFAIRQLAYIGTGDDFMKVPSVDLVHELLGLASAPIRLLVDRTYDVQPQWLAGGLLFILPWLLLRRAGWLLPSALWMMFSLLALVALDVARTTSHISLVRYMAVASPAVVLVAVGCARAIDVRAAYALACGFVFMCGIYVYSGLDVTADSKTFDSTIRSLETRIKPGEAILAYHGSAPVYYGDMMMLTCAHSKSLFPRPVINLTRPVSPETLGRLPKRVWLLAAGLDTPIETLVPGARVMNQYSADVGMTMFHLEIIAPSATRPSTQR